MALPGDFAIDTPMFSVELSLTSSGVRDHQPVVWDTLGTKFVWNPDSCAMMLKCVLPGPHLSGRWKLLASSVVRQA